MRRAGRLAPRGGAALGVALLAAGCGQPGDSGNAAQGKIVAATPSPAAPTGVASLSEAEQQAAAFRAVFGKAAPATVKDADGAEAVIKPARLLWRDGKAILLTTSEKPDACHACVGSVGVYYLTPSGKDFTVTGRFANAISGNGFGGLPDWSVSDKFETRPVIYAEAGYTAQGYTCTSFTLTELGEKGPVPIAQVPIDYDDSGANDPATVIEGKLGTIVRDQSFTIDYKGAKRFSETYRRTAKGFALDRPTQMQTC